MVFLQLFFTFFKIGLFGFGGGYAMLSMIQGEVVTKYHWLTTYEFTDIVAMSQMTPGPIGINSATYVGYTAIVNAGYSHAVGILGSCCSTFAVVLPSFILMILISKFFLRYKEHPVIAAVFSGLRPGVVGLLAAASLVLMNSENFGTETRQIVISCILFLGTFIASYRFKVNPIMLICICGVIGLFTSCSGSGRGESAVALGDTLRLNHARQLTLVECDGYTKAVVHNPWREGETLHTYILADSGSTLPENIEGEVVRTPLKHALVYSSVHCSLMSDLGAEQSLGGVCDLDYIYLPWVKEGNAQGRITDCGSSMNPDIETVIDTHPDAVLLSPFENSGGYGRIEKLGIPIIECADYMETSALGRAEWMRFFGRLFGKAEVADSLYTAVEREYLSLAETVKAHTNSAGPGSAPAHSQLSTLNSQLSTEALPLLIAELKTGSVWYVPGGNSTMGRLYQDAGADYVFSSLEQSGSVPLSFETVYEQGHDADIWIIKYHQPADKTYRELLSDYEPYRGFKAFRERNIYGCNTAKTLYYELTPFRPDLLLRDIISIVHPGLLDDYTPMFFKRLAE